MKIPTHTDLYLPTLQALEKLGGSANIDEIDDSLIELLALNQEQLDMTYPKSGAAIVTDRMSWARSYLKYPKFLDNPKRGMWVLTEEGRAAAKWDEKKLKTIVNEAANADTLARKIKKSKNSERSSIPGEPGEQIDWYTELLNKLQAIEPSAFERLCQRLLRACGFTRVEVTGKSGDGGIDGQGVLRMNLVSFHVLFQCKRYKGSVGAGTIRDFRGAMQGRADKGLVITTGTFTPDARREATRDGAPAIDLIDGEALCELLREQQLGITVKSVVTEVVTIDELFFEDI
jgi:restriction system protein